MPRIVIVGAGISGLALCYRLQKRQPDWSITLLEKRDRPGGNIWTEYRDGFRVEIGPNGFLDSKPTTMQLCQDLGIAEQLISASEGSRKNRYLFWKGKLQALPNSLGSFIRTPLLSVRGKINLLLESYRRKPSPYPQEESVAEFARRRAGKEAATIFADAIVTGIHGGDPELLSVACAFPRLVQMEQEHGSVFKAMSRNSKKKKQEAQARGEAPPSPAKMWSFPQGLRFLIEQLQQAVGPALLTDLSVTKLEKSGSQWLVHGSNQTTYSADALILTSPAYHQADLLNNVDSKLAQELAAIQYNKIAVVALGFYAKDVPTNIDGFGYIAPQHLRRDLLGVQWCSSIFPDRAPPGMVLWRALCGGWHRGEMLNWEDDRLIQAVQKELRLAMGVTASPTFSHIVRWPKAIPQYMLGTSARWDRIALLQKNHTGLHLAGNAFHGVALNDCVEQADQLIMQLQQQFSVSQ